MGELYSGLAASWMMAVDRLLAGRRKFAGPAEGDVATGAEADPKAEKELQSV